MKPWKVLTAVGVALVAVGLSLPVIFAAGADAPPTLLKLDTAARFDSKGGKVPGQFVLSASLKTADAKPLSDKQIKFFQETDFFGLHDALLGSATTDLSGNATLLFQPAQTGTAKLKAQFVGDAQAAPQAASTSLLVQTASSPYKPQPPPLAPVAIGLVWGVCIVAVGVWAVLLGVLLRTTLGIRAVGRH